MPAIIIGCVAFYLFVFTTHWIAGLCLLAALGIATMMAME